MMRPYFDRVKAQLHTAYNKLINTYCLKREPVINNEKSDGYFDDARSWADDMYVSVVASRNRYRFFLYLSVALVFVLVVCISMLIPAQHIEPLLIHHYNDGRVAVERLNNPYKPDTKEEVESDLVRYVINRESYDPVAYDLQYRITNLLSGTKAASEYSKEQSIVNSKSPINTLGKKYYRSVHVDNILFLDNESLNTKEDSHHVNLAQVNYLVTVHSIATGKTHATAYAALISWEYRGAPSDPEERWIDWNGFVITKFQRTQRSLKG